MLGAAFEVRETWSKRVSTGQLNRWFEDAVGRNPPPAPGGKRIKLRYITQVNTRPPSFVLFGTRVDQLPDSYLRYLVNGLRKELGFGAVPVRLSARASRNPFEKGTDPRQPAVYRGGIESPRTRRTHDQTKESQVGPAIHHTRRMRRLIPQTSLRTQYDQLATYKPPQTQI